jgi:amidase
MKDRKTRGGSVAMYIAAIILVLAVVAPARAQKPFDVMEATIEDIHAAYKSGKLTSRQLTQLYLDRIAQYDQKGPKINCIITLNPKALEDADKLDAAFKSSGIVGPMHGIPVVIKDQLDVGGLPTTMGSVVFKNWVPDRDSFVVANLRKAGAIILAKVTLGEMGGGDTYGSLFGATRNPYDLDRTVGGSSGGPAAAVTANFATVAVAEEGYASIRRPATWNSVIGLRPTPGLVSRTGMWNGYPDFNGSLGPMARTVADAVKLLDQMVGYDSDDPVTAFGVGKIPQGGYAKFLDKNALKGARVGIIRESIGQDSEPDSQDFKNVSEVFNKAVRELQEAGAQVLDPVVIPNLKELLATRTGSPNSGGEDIGWKTYFRNQKPPYPSRQAMMQSPEYAKVLDRGRPRGIIPTGGSPRTPEDR